MKAKVVVEREAKDPNISQSSKESDDEEINDNECEKNKKEQRKTSILTYFKFLWAILNSTMVSMTKYLNRFSNDYRYIRKVLTKEKKLLKVRFLLKSTLTYIKDEKITLLIDFRQNQISKWENDWV